MRKRLLLVDDEPRNLSVLDGLLAPLGHETIRAPDGRTALELFVRQPPDLVLLDFLMPDFDGIDVLTHIRAQPANAHVPIILVTAHTEREHRLRGLEAGADEFLEKPIDGPILLTRVRTLLGIKEAWDALAERNVALEQLQRQQRDLMAFIVHDLKNPLSVVWSSLHWVRENLRDPELAAEGLDDAQRAARRLRVMIEDLLLVSRLEDSQFPIRPEVIDLGDLLADLLRVYGRLAEEKRVALVGHTDAGFHVRTDRTLLRRVLENVLDNSLRYTPRDGRVAIGARAADNIEIAVSNTGPTIPRAERQRIFEKFVRGDHPVTSSGNAGLGLYFCRCAMNALGGQIEVVDTPEWPTSFVMQLPTG